MEEALTDDSSGSRVAVWNISSLTAERDRGDAHNLATTRSLVSPGIHHACGAHLRRPGELARVDSVTDTSTSDTNRSGEPSSFFP